MENIQTLITNIRNSNLSDSDKEKLIEILTADDIDYDKLTRTFLVIFKTAKEVLKLFDIDIGSD